MWAYILFAVRTATQHLEFEQGQLAIRRWYGIGNDVNLTTSNNDITTSMLQRAYNIKSIRYCNIKIVALVLVMHFRFTSLLWTYL